MVEHTLEHPSIGSIKGIRKTPAVVQYLGIQYGSLKNRFSRAQLVVNPPADHICRSRNVIDATRKGPSHLLPPDACEDHQKTIVQKNLPIEEWEQSDTEGLTLDVSVPIDGPKSLPVFVFVPGGGFTSGSSNYPEYDLANITDLSVQANMPMVSVGVNYRIGPPGFMYSSALRDQGYLPNNGLADQRLAFTWIKHNISGFGGDPDRVTFVGESAGAVSGWFHLQSPEPLFHQLVALSGSSFLKPRPLALLEKGFTLAAAELGAATASPEEQVRKLAEAPKDEFISKLGRKIPVGPFEDGDLVRTPPTFADINGEERNMTELFPALRHCKRVIMGDCQMDGLGFHSRLAPRTDILPQTLAQCLHSVFDPIDTNIAPAIASAYGLDVNARINSLESTKPCLDFAADVLFALPTRYLTRALAAADDSNNKVYLCHFNCPNPWDGPGKGHATHALDIIFALQNYRGYLSAGQQQCSERLAKDLIAFVNGEEPWPAYDRHRPGSMVYFASMEAERDASEYIRTLDPAKTGRKTDLVDLVDEESLDKLVQACQMFLVGPLVK